MFDNSVSVFSRAASKCRKLFLITELFVQLMFIGYYAYLLVVNKEQLVLLIAYSVLIFLATSVFFVMVFTLDPYQKKAFKIKKKIRRVARIISWTGKATVIGYNIYRLVAVGMSETGLLLQVFSIIVFVLEIGFFVVSTIFTYYSRLLIYALQMDYQQLIGKKEDIDEKPIGRILIAANNNEDHEEEVNKLFVEQEIYEVIKKQAYAEKHTTIKRRKLERQLLRYYENTLDYYRDNNKLTELYDDIEILGLDKKEYPHLFVLEFFLINYIEQVYVGLNNQYMRFVLCGLSNYRDTNYMPVIDMVYHVIIKHLYKNKEWDKPLNTLSEEKRSFFSFLKKEQKEEELSTTKKKYNDVKIIIQEGIEEFEEESKKTIGGEIESIVSSTIKKKVHGSLKNKFKNIFKKKK